MPLTSKIEYKVRYAISKANRGFKTFERQADAWIFYDEKCAIAEAVVELIQVQTTVIARKESEMNNRTKHRQQLTGLAALCWRMLDDMYIGKANDELPEPVAAIDSWLANEMDNAIFAELSAMIDRGELPNKVWTEIK